MAARELVEQASSGAHRHADDPPAPGGSQAELRLQLETLLAATGRAAITFDRAGKIRSWDGAAERMFGFSAAAAIGMSMDAILPRLQKMRRASAKTTGASAAWLAAHYPTESRELGLARDRSGRQFSVDATFVTWKTASGDKRAGVIVDDITERRIKEEELRRSRMHLAEAQNIGGIGSWDWNLGTSDIELSDAMCKLLGAPCGTRRTPLDALELIHRDDRKTWQEAMDRMIAGETVQPVTYRTVAADGRSRTFVSTARLVQYSDGPHLIGVVRDITEEAEKEAERARQEVRLRLSQMHLADAQRIGGVGSWDWHLPSGAVHRSDEMLKLIGIGHETERSIEDVVKAVHPDDRDSWMSTMNRFAAGEDAPPLSYRMVLADGSQRVFQIAGRRAEYADGAHVIGVIRDITDQTQQEAERTRQEEKLRLSQMHLSEAQRVGGIGSWDWHIPSGEITPSEEMRNLVGMAADARRTHADARASIHPDDRDAWQAAMDRMAAGDKVPPVTFRMIRPDASVRVFQSTGQRVEHVDGPHVVGILKDITERTQLEAERRENEKMSALGQLAGGVAHEINNLLQPVITLSEIAVEDLESGLDPAIIAEMRHNLALVTKCGRDAREIVRKILRYARKETPTLELTSVIRTLGNSTELMRGLLSPGVMLEVEIPEESEGLARINGAEMTQIVTNLAVNADHAMKGQGRLRIALEKASLTEAQASALEIAPGEYFLIRAADTGSGMDAATKARIFDPFFTTKPLGQGTGLGLSMVHGILKSWSGAISVESEIGKGTEFRLYIPVARAP